MHLLFVLSSQLGGIVTPNDGKCHLEDFNGKYMLYTKSNELVWTTVLIFFIIVIIRITLTGRYSNAYDITFFSSWKGVIFCKPDLLRISFLHNFVPLKTSSSRV